MRDLLQDQLCIFQCALSSLCCICMHVQRHVCLCMHSLACVLDCFRVNARFRVNVLVYVCVCCMVLFVHMRSTQNVYVCACMHVCMYVIYVYVCMCMHMHPCILRRTLTTTYKQHCTYADVHVLVYTNACNVHCMYIANTFTNTQSHTLMRTPQ